MNDEWNTRPTSDPGEIRFCAEMMAASDPWKYFGYTPQECERNLTDSSVRVDLAVGPNDRIIGFLASMANGVSFAPVMEYLCVAPDYRNQGVGRYLVRHFEEELYPEEKNLFLFVSDVNGVAARLYIRLGYLPVGALPDYNFPAQTEFLFRKTRGPKRNPDG